ncbi:MAG: 30S ribosomal protein S20 [Egibacteraceae bacterium]
MCHPHPTRSRTPRNTRDLLCAVYRPEVSDREGAAQAYQTAAQKLDKAAQSGIVHRNFAANHKAKMAQRPALQRLLAGLTAAHDLRLPQLS